MTRLSDLRPYLRFRPYFWWLVSSVGLSVATLSASLGLLAVSGGFLTDTGLAGLVPATALLYNTIIPAGAIRLLALVRVSGRWSERVVSHEATLRLLGELRVWLFSRLSRLSPRQLGLRHGGEVLHRLTRDVDLLDNLFVRLLSPVTAAVVVFALSVAVVAAVSPAAAVPVALLGLACAILLAALYRGARTLTPRLVARHERLRIALLDLAEGLDDTSLHRPAWEAQRRAALGEDAARLDDQAALQRRGAAGRALTTLLLGLAAGAVGVLAAPASGPWAVALALLTLGLSEALAGLPAAWLELPGTAAAARRLSDLADQKPHPEFAAGGVAPSEPAHLELEGVGFAYPDEEPILRSLSVRWPLGSHIALLGPSGGGKTTLARLLTRLEDPTEGRVLLSGTDLREWDAAAFRRSVTGTPQDSRVLRMTLADNLRLAAPVATEPELWNMLELVGLAGQVRAWPKGLDTWVEEDGASLSGGQRKRLAVAQALLRRCPITVLDEPTEGLDAEAAQALADAVRRELDGRTLVWITHRSEGLSDFGAIVRLSGYGA